MSTVPSEDTIVSWFFSPNKAERAAKPVRPYNARVDTIAESIKLTMEYLAAANKPFNEGRPRTIAHKVDKGQLSLFWSIYEKRTDVEVTRDGETKTVTTILYYGFDAGGRLTLETVTSPSFEEPYKQYWSWPNSESVPMPHRIKIMRNLKELRASLLVS